MMTSRTGTWAGAAYLCALAFLVSLAPFASAQLATGRVVGTVRPTTSAVITLQSEQGASFSSHAYEGGFSFEQVPVGAYTLLLSASGFEPFRLESVQVEPSSAVLLAPIDLLPAGEVYSVEVRADPTPLSGLDAGLTSTISSEQVEHLPVIGRDVLSLINVEAGVGQNGQAFTTINGLRTASSAVTLDGVNIQDNYIRANSLDFVPNRLRPDQVSAFSVVLQNGRADSGGAASFVDFTTPSGGTRWAGSVYGHLRNSAFAANNWFNNRAGIPQSHLNRAMPGVSVGGPIVPGKLYIYANYEAERRDATSAVNKTILTSAARGGLFTYRDLSGRERQLNLLLASGNVYDPQVASLLRELPDPTAANTFDVGDSTANFLRNTVGYRLDASNDLDRDQLLTRWDYIPGADWGLLSASLQFVGEDGERPDLGAAYSGAAQVKQRNRVFFLSAGWRREWANWTGSIRGGFNRDDGRFLPTEENAGPILNGFVFSNPIGSIEREGRRTRTSSFRSDWTLSQNRHRFSFGGQQQSISARVESFAGLRPAFDIGISLANPSGLRPEMFFGGVTGQDFQVAQQMLASLAGYVAQGAQAFNVNAAGDGYAAGVPFRRNFFQHFAAFYGRHEWRLLPNLSLDSGIRWEYWGRFDEEDGLLLAPIEVLNDGPSALLSNAVIDFAGGANGRPLTRPDRNNWAPSIGLAWSPGSGETVVRAGYGISYFNDEALLSADRATSENQGLRAESTLRNQVINLGAGLPEFTAPVFQLPQSAAVARQRNPTSAISAIDPALRTPYVQQWHLGVQRRLSRGLVAEVRYVGNRASGLLRGLELNRFEIEDNGFLDDFGRARSNGFAAQQAGLDFDPRYNPSIAGSSRLSVLPRLQSGGLLANETVRSLIRADEAGELAALYVVNRMTAGSVVAIAANPNTFGAHLLTNAADSSYHAGQASIRANLNSGLRFHANYTFSKVLTDAGDSADRFDPYLDSSKPGYERARADFDLTHAFKLNFVWSPSFSQLSGLPRKIATGWTLSGIATWQSGSPLSILSSRGTRNRRDRSNRNTATTLLTQRDLNQIVGLRVDAEGPSIISGDAINPTDGTGVAADGAEPFPGQVFYHPDSGSVGTLQARTFNGPVVFDLDLGIERALPLGESARLKLGARAANVLNHPGFFAGSQRLDSPQFGRLTSTLVGGRVVELFARIVF